MPATLPTPAGACPVVEYGRRVTALQDAEETITPAADVLLDVRGVDHRPPAPLRHLGAMGRWSRLCVAAAVVCALLAVVAHVAAARLEPDESVAASKLRSGWRWDPAVWAVGEAIEDARLGKAVDPGSVMIVAAGPGSAGTVDRSRVVKEINFQRFSTRVHDVIVDWDLRMYDVLVAQRAWAASGNATFGPDVFPGENELFLLYDDLRAAESADRAAALHEYGRLSTLDSWYAAGRWLAAGFAAVALLTAAALRRAAVRRQWGDVRRFRLARSAYRRLVRAGERIG